MNILIAYDSIYGNTQKIAQAVAEELSAHATRVKKVNAVTDEDLRSADLLIAGSPTHGGRASQDTKDFFARVPAGSLKNARAAAFDTGIPVEGQNGFVKFIVRFFGYAAPHIAKALRRKGATVIAAETFFVKGKEGPLNEGETERAKQWARKLVSNLN